MNLWTLLWILSQAMQLIFLVLAIRQPAVGILKKRLSSLTISAFASILPLITLNLFLFVFVIGGSSNVAQLAGNRGMGLWQLWFSAWPILFLGNPTAFLIALGTTLFPPYPPAHSYSWASRAFAIPAAAFATYAVVAFFPDA